MFKVEAITKEEENFKKLVLAPEQRGIVESMANVLVQFIDLPNLATMGFIWRAVKEWQLKYKRTVSELSTSDVEDRLASVKEMTEMLKRYLFRVLKYSTDEEKISLGVDKMYDFYKGQFSTR